MNYQSIADGLPLAMTMFELTGGAREGFFSQFLDTSEDPAVMSTNPLLSAKQRRAWLALHAERPTVLASHDNPPDSRITGNHSYPVSAITPRPRQSTSSTCSSTCSSSPAILIDRSKASRCRKCLPTSSTSRSTSRGPRHRTESARFNPGRSGDVVLQP